MRKLVASTVVVGSVLFFITVTLVTTGVLRTMRSEANGPLAVSGADLLNMGTLAQLRVSLVSTGGKVLRLGPCEVTVLTRQGHVLSITFAPRAVFRYRGIAVTQAAIEPGAHLTVLGLRGSNGFDAVKVYISPHHHAIGGRVESGSSIEPGRGGLATIVNRHNALQVVKLLPGTAITFNKQPVRGLLHAGTHVVVLAVPDPRDPGIFLADSVRVVPLATSVRLGGLIRNVNAVRNVITIFNRTENQLDTIEVIPGTTKITLSRWDAGYGDMNAGDHVTVTGVTDPTNAAVGPNPIRAIKIRINSPNFGGVVTGIAPAPNGGVVLAVRARHGHVVRIDAPGRTPVYYGAGVHPQLAHVLDLTVGEKIAVPHGTRVGKFEIVAASIRVYPRSHTVGGAVASILPGAYRIVSSTDGSQVIIHVGSFTTYTVNGKSSTAAAVQVGLHIRVYGYDALHSDQKNIPTLIARHVSVIVHQHHVHVARHQARHRTTSVPSPAITPLPVPSSTQHAA